MTTLYYAMIRDMDFILWIMVSYWIILTENQEKKNPDNRNSSTEDPDIDVLVIARILWEKKSKVGGLILQILRPL